jgi:VanZ family protein
MTPAGRAATGYAAPLARLALVIALLLVVYASLYPFTGWTDVGVSAFAYLQAPWPRYWVGSEIVANIAAYAPLGALIVWAIYPLCRGVVAILLAVVACALVSGSLEALQTFLPDRIASNVDLAANIAGGLAGSVLAALTASWLIAGGAVMRWRLRWFIPEAGPALILALLWVVVQVPRQAMLFGTGELRTLGDWAGVPADLVGDFWAPSPLQRMWAEQLCTGGAILGVSMLLLHVARPVRARGLAPIALIAAALAVKALVQPLAVPGVQPDVWITDGALNGCVAGVLVALALAYLPSRAQRVIAICALIVQLVIVNLFPVDQYFDTSSAFSRARWLHLETLTLGLSVIWPLAALLALMRRRRTKA